MEKEIPRDSIAISKGANAKVRQWYLKNLGKNSRLFIPNLNGYVYAVEPKEIKGEGMKL